MSWQTWRALVAVWCAGLWPAVLWRRGSGGLSGPAGRGPGARANASILSVLTSASRSSLGCDRPAFRYLVGRVHDAHGVVLLHPLQPVPRRPVSLCVPGRKPLFAIIDFLGNCRGRDRQAQRPSLALVKPCLLRDRQRIPRLAKASIDMVLAPPYYAIAQADSELRADSVRMS